MSKSIGVILKLQRDLLNYSISEVSELTKIRPEIIQKLESDEFKSIGAHVYVKGFIKNYAKFLNVDVNLLLSIYKKDFENEQLKIKVEENKKLVKTQTERKYANKEKFTNKLESKLNIQRKHVIIGLSIVVIFISTVSIFALVYSIFKAPYLKIFNPKELIVDQNTNSISLSTSEEYINITGITQEGAKVFVNNEPVILKPGFAFESEPIQLNSTKTIVLVEAVNNLGIKNTLRIEVSRSINSITEDNKQEIIVESNTDNIFVLARADGVIEFNNQLYRSDIIVLKANNSIEIECSHPDSVTIKYNNKSYKLNKSIQSFKIQNGELITSN